MSEHFIGGGGGLCREWSSPCVAESSRCPSKTQNIRLVLFIIHRLIYLFYLYTSCLSWSKCWISMTSSSWWRTKTEKLKLLFSCEKYKIYNKTKKINYICDVRLPPPPPHPPLSSRGRSQGWGCCQVAVVSSLHFVVRRSSGMGVCVCVCVWTVILPSERVYDGRTEKRKRGGEGGQVERRTGRTGGRRCWRVDVD